MSYVTISEVINYGGFDSDFDSDQVDHDLLEDFITQVETFIEEYTGRDFEVSTVTTRNFDSVKDVEGVTLFLDEDLIVDTDTSITNGDGTAINSSDYVTEPRNESPVWAITLLGSTGFYWKDNNNGDAEDAISIAGHWGFSTTPPSDIKHVTLRLVKWMYDVRNNSGEAPLISPEGILIMKDQVPNIVWNILNRYKKVTV